MRHPYFELPTPIVLGHRGCAGEAPENSLEGFRQGLATGAAILESDVHLTRDGVPVLIHDDRVDRISDGSGRVADLTASELRRLDAGYRFTPDRGRTYPFRNRGIRIPTLEEAFAALPGARFNLELKEDLPGIVGRTLEIVSGADREDLTLLTAADDALMAKLRAALGRRDRPVAQGASRGDVLAFLRNALAGTAPEPGAQALQVPASFGGQPLVTPELVAHAHAHDVQVHVWTIDDPGEMATLLDLGVDGLVTNYPARLAGVVASRGFRD